MQYKVLGKTKLRVSCLGLGTMTFGGQVDVAIAQKIVDESVEAGINFFDTAHMYGYDGESGRLIAAAIGDRRDEFVIATKRVDFIGTKVAKGFVTVVQRPSIVSAVRALDVLKRITWTCCFFMLLTGQCLWQKLQEPSMNSINWAWSERLDCPMSRFRKLKNFERSVPSRCASPHTIGCNEKLTNICCLGVASSRFQWLSTGH